MKYLLLSRQDRIGHLLVEFYNYYMYHDEKICLVVLNADNVANHQIYKMWLQKLDNKKIKYIEVRNSFLLLLAKVLIRIANRLRLSFYDDFKELNAKKYYDKFKSGKYLLGTTTFDGLENKYFHKYPINMTFSKFEEGKGSELIKALDLKEKEYVLFHTRDGEYLNETSSYHDYRNSFFETFVSSIKYLSQKNVKSLRFGVSKFAIRDLDINYIDYAKDFRTDFLDVYLVSKARYFVGSTSGAYSLSFYFGTPTIITNAIPINFIYTKENDIFLSKKLYNRITGEQLTLEYILKNKIFYTRTDEYVNNNIKIVDNTEKEIYEACKEMELQLGGEDIYFKNEDMMILDSFISLMNKYLPEVTILGKPSLYFLKSYPLYCKGERVNDEK